MFPLYDDQPTKRFPALTLLIIALNVWVFVSWQLRVGIEQSVTMLIPLGIFTRLIEIPAFVFLLIWIGLQILSQAASQVPARHASGGVAYLAHIGGFAAGMILIFFFQKRNRSRSLSRSNF